MLITIAIVSLFVALFVAFLRRADGAVQEARVISIAATVIATGAMTVAVAMVTLGAPLPALTFGVTVATIATAFAVATRGEYRDELAALSRRRQLIAGTASPALAEIIAAGGLTIPAIMNAPVVSVDDINHTLGVYGADDDKFVVGYIGAPVGEDDDGCPYWPEGALAVAHDW